MTVVLLFLDQCGAVKFGILPTVMRRLGYRSILLTALLVTASATAGYSQTSPASNAAAQTKTSTESGRQSPLQEAISALASEISDVLRTPDSHVRLASDYFSSTPLPEDVTTEQVLSAIARVPRGSDARVQHYVQWQLLSALPEELDGRSAAMLLRLYQSAPRPVVRPGLERKEQQRLARVAQQAGQEKESELTKQLTDAVDSVAAQNRFLLHYRDELFDRLPKTYDTLAAGFEDAIVRLETGADAEEHAGIVIEAVRAWANEKASPGELQAMNRLVLKVKNIQGPELFDQAEWKSQYRRMEWRKRRPSLNAGYQLDELADELYAMAKDGKSD